MRLALRPNKLPILKDLQLMFSNVGQKDNMGAKLRLYRSRSVWRHRSPVDYQFGLRCESSCGIISAGCDNRHIIH